MEAPQRWSSAGSGRSTFWRIAVLLEVRGCVSAASIESRFFALSGIDPEFAMAFNRVLHLAAEPESLLKPKWLLRAALNSKRQAADFNPRPLPASS